MVDSVENTFENQFKRSCRFPHIKTYRTCGNCDSSGDVELMLMLITVDTVDKICHLIKCKRLKILTYLFVQFL